MTHTLTIPNWRPRPLNQISTNGFKRARQKKADAEMVAGYARLAGLPKATTRRRVDLFVVPGAYQGRADKDAYWKAGLDALKRAGLLVNDSGKWCEPGEVTHGSRAKDGPPRTVITLTDID